LAIISCVISRLTGLLGRGRGVLRETVEAGVALLVKPLLAGELE
jgi:hypothetical protein